MAEQLPEAIFGSIELMYVEKIEKETLAIEQEYEQKYNTNELEKKQNLQDLRPNLSNPACKEELAALDKKEITRFTTFSNTIDETQFKLLECLRVDSKKYFLTVLNTTSSNIYIYSALFFHEDFILLPGDDVSEKKHLNIKNLMVQREKEGGYVERTNRGLLEKWKGLPKKAFEVDFTNRPEFKKEDKQEEEKKEPGEENTEAIESIKTSYHKILIKQRDESFKRFKLFFDEKLKKYFAVYDAHRVAELKFKESWEKNVGVLRNKQDIKA